MSQTETSMLVVKPDGVKKKLVQPIRHIINSRGLAIKHEVCKILKPGTVEMLYWNISDVRQRDYFRELVTFMSSSPVHIFIVEGEDAVKKVRQIIGKRGSSEGIRNIWAESIIRNVAHGPHTEERAAWEIKLLLEDNYMKKVFLIGGMSESGKSTLGRYLDNHGIKRLKITFFLHRIMERERAQGDFYKWVAQCAKERPEWLNREFTSEFVQWTREQGIQYCCLESLYGPDLGIFMREQLGSDRVVVVYVDIDEDARLKRQMIRQKLASIDEAKQLMLPRDQVKREWRTPEITDVADVVIDNSGSLESFTNKAHAMITTYCPELPIKG